MKEILAQNLDGIALYELDLFAKMTYKGELYQIWKLEEDEFKKLCEVPEEKWKKEYGMWRYSEGSNVGNCISTFIINEKHITAWDGDLRVEALHEDEVFRGRKYKTLLEYFCEELGASQPKNICALAVELAKINNITMGELFVIYQG